MIFDNHFRENIGQLAILQKPLWGYLFTSNAKNYFYDSCSSEIIVISAFYKRMLTALLKKTKKDRINSIIEISLDYQKKKIINALMSITKGQIDKNIFNNYPSNISIFLSNRESIPHLNHLVIEVTQKCNFRCSYCIYGKHYPLERRYTNRVIKKKLIYKAIDFFLHHKGHPEPKITFFGGEPLIVFALIKDLINYATNIDNKIIFNIMTNGYLITKEYFLYIIKNDINLRISLDGDLIEHDRNRILKNGKGTFAKIIKNFTQMIEIDREFVEKKVSVCITISDMKKIERIMGYFNNEPIFKKIQFTYNKLNMTSANDYNSDFSSLLVNKKQNKIMYNYLSNYKTEPYKVKSEHSFLFPFVKMIINRKPITKNFFLNNLCMPAQWKLYVNVDGDYRFCEKTDNLPVIGNVNDGLDWNLIYLISKELELFYKSCTKCWALGICNVCWADLYNEQHCLDKELKNKACFYKKRDIKIGLKMFVEIIENHEQFLNFNKY